jgi:dynein heavy chain
LNISLAVLEQDKFYKLQEKDEAELNDKIDFIIGSVTNIAIQNDIKKINEICSEIQKTWKIMKESYEFGIILNSRQKLFGVPVVPFSKLSSLIRDFEPYKNFWLTAEGSYPIMIFINIF